MLSTIPLLLCAAFGAGDTKVEVFDFSDKPFENATVQLSPTGKWKSKDKLSNYTGENGEPAEFPMARLGTWDVIHARALHIVDDEPLETRLEIRRADAKVWPPPHIKLKLQRDRLTRSAAPGPTTAPYVVTFEPRIDPLSGRQVMMEIRTFVAAAATSSATPTLDVAKPLYPTVWNVPQTLSQPAHGFDPCSCVW